VDEAQHDHESDAGERELPVVDANPADRGEDLGFAGIEPESRGTESTEHADDLGDVRHRPADLLARLAGNDAEEEFQDGR
jgi:hypothetical protein